MRLIAGTENLLNDLHINQWCFLDIGFSNNRRTCGLLIGNDNPIKLTYSEAAKSIVCFAKMNENICLVIEAPLSVSFDKNGNPIGRKVEKENGRTRYWYNSPGSTVLVSALYLLHTLYNEKLHTKVHLFEGFVSFRSNKGRLSHLNDVVSLKKMVENYHRCKNTFFFYDSLCMTDTDSIQSLGKVAGFDFGVPPLIKVTD